MFRLPISLLLVIMTSALKLNQQNVTIFTNTNMPVSPGNYSNFTDSSVEITNITINNYTVPSDKQTIYICKMFRIGANNNQTGNATNVTYHHAFRMEPIIEPAGSIHHLLLYGCADDTTFNPNLVENCEDMNPQCSAILGGAAVGTGGFILPPEVGVIWGAGLSKIVYLQVHINNPDYPKPLTVTGGLEVYHTPKLRPFNMGMMLIGKSVTEIVLPPNKTTIIQDTCGANCTKNIKDDGIFIFVGLLHGHKTLKKIRSELHYSNGTVDENFLRNDNYDFNNQRFDFLNPAVPFKSGDSIVTICEFDTAGITKTIYGGYSTNDEMCLTFLGYYPLENGLFLCGDSLGCF